MANITSSERQNVDRELTIRQEQILNFISDQIGKLGYAPTIAEIQSEFSFKSPNAVQEHLRALDRKGKIRRNRNQWRGLEVVSGDAGRRRHVVDSAVRIPLIGRVPAGSPVLSEENFDGTIAIDSSFLPKTDKLFALKVHGTSMINAGILDGDIIIAKQQSVAENSDIVVATVDNEVTVKRFHRKRGAVILKPENDSMRPISVSTNQDFRILGLVVASFRQIR